MLAKHTFLYTEDMYRKELNKHFKITEVLPWRCDIFVTYEENINNKR